MVEAFEAFGKEKGWTVNVIDTAGDVAAAVGRIEDAANQKVSAIVINVDPTQVQAGLEAAKAAGVPVFGMDAGTDPLLVTNVTSNGYAMASETATFVVDAIGGKATWSCSSSIPIHPSKNAALSPMRSSLTTQTSRFCSALSLT